MSENGKNRYARVKKARRSSLFVRGEPMVWLTGGAMALSMVMILGLLLLVFVNGMGTFWPEELVQIETVDGRVLLGELNKDDTYVPEEAAFRNLPESLREAARNHVAANDGKSDRRMFRTGNYELTREHFTWVSDFEIKDETLPEWAVVLERLSWGRFYGLPSAFKVDGKVVAEGPEASWKKFEEVHDEVLERREDVKHLEEHDIGDINARIEDARLEMKQEQLDHGKKSAEAKAAASELAEVEAAAAKETAEVNARIKTLRDENDKYVLVVSTADGQPQEISVAQIVRAYPANQLGWGDKMGVYLSRWWEYLWDDPREANQEGGVFPAIFGTIVMTMIMTIMVVPFGVLGALYIREYAKQGPLVSMVRIAINNLAGVPSIVFGVFGLGFFCYILGFTIDELFFEARLPNPTYGKGGIMWASLTLALLTLPVVVVATEEALAAVPNSMREGSYACGASKWQTIRRIVLPRAMPGIMTGMILAIARGAGEVAPLMLVGAVKLAPELPIDGSFPFVHPERSFMHLGFHIYDLGFQSPNSEAAKPMVFTTTLLLIGIVVVLNIIAIWARARLRRAYIDV